ncbi:hypothetical protein [Roseomonas indoligenes]|uniref:Uncharacterized protein n=1 Tax=Roseomonas indoligenes TaxID=2820811 RepID=A0A940MSK0_9PROT|nr:hypothetical protein [Pararoseomonas indoligenes]MBP0493308.1 hypothetical protein [Pararoseomonas indoligenes]
MPAALLPLAVAALGWAVLLAAGPRAGLAAYPLAPLLYFLSWVGLGLAPGWRVAVATVLVSALLLVVIPAAFQVGLILGTVLIWVAAGALVLLDDIAPAISRLGGPALPWVWIGPSAFLAGAVLAHIALAIRNWAERSPVLARRGTALCGAVAAFAVAYAVTIRLSGAAEAPLPFAVLLVGFAPHALLTRRAGTPGPLRLLLVAALVVALPALLLTCPPATTPSIPVTGDGRMT